MNDLRSQLQRIGVPAGPLLATVLYFLLPTEYNGPDGDMVAFTSAGRIALGVLVWMAIWWLTEAVELSTTALIPVAVLPALGAIGIKEAAAPYAHHLIFLFIGGFTAFTIL